MSYNSQNHLFNKHGPLYLSVLIYGTGTVMACPIYILGAVKERWVKRLFTGLAGRLHERSIERKLARI